MPSNGPDWDGAIVKDSIVYPIGRMINYPPPFVKMEKYVPPAKTTALQNHLQNLVPRSSRSKLKVTSRADYDIIEDNNSESENDEDKENYDSNQDNEENEPSVQSVFGGLKKPAGNRKRNSKSKKKNKLQISKSAVFLPQTFSI